jgi:hypothetical protein
LVAIADAVRNIDKVFLGNGTALEFARRNAHCFDRIISCARLESDVDAQSLISQSDAGLIVMEQDMAFWMTKLGRPFYFFDSLLGFWILHRDLDELINAAEQILRRDTPSAYDLFQTFSPHEQKLISHVLAKRSYAQNYVGVPQRIEDLRRRGVDHIELVTSIVTSDLFEPPPRVSANYPWEMVINLGGIENFILQFHANDYYVDLVERWAREFLSTRTDCHRITICCGRYEQTSVESIDGRVLYRALLPHQQFVSMVRDARIYITSPGLTAINEAVRMGRMPILLPEQHYSQYYNVYSLQGTLMGSLAVTLQQLFDNYSVPTDDYHGSAVIVEYAHQLCESPDKYRLFSHLLSQRVNSMITFPSHIQAQAISEIRELFDGPDLDVVIDRILAEVQR